jgi:hypothetical protein
MDALSTLITVICLIAGAMTWYFGLGARRSSRALWREVERRKLGSGSGSARPARGLLEMELRRSRERELRRTRRNRTIYAAVCAAIFFLSYYVLDERMPAQMRGDDHPRLPPDLTTQRLMISIFLSWLLIAAAGCFVFFVIRLLFLTAIAQRHRNPNGRSIVRDTFRLSSYDEKGRSHLRRAGTSGLLSIAGLVAFFVVFAVLHFAQ